MSDMWSVVKTAPGKGNLAIERRPVPIPGPRDILVRVQAAAVCGTDVHIEEWNDRAEKRVPAGVIIGHEFAGDVVQVGSEVGNIRVGDIVSAETHIVCHGCDLCRNNHDHVCYNTRTIGVHRDGCFAEYIAFPAENAFVCDQRYSVDVLSMMEPFGAAVHGAMEFPVAGKSVAVVGCGPIGVMAVAVVKKLGARMVVAIEPNALRADMARHMGADAVVNPLEVDPVTTVKSLTPGGHGVDVVLEYSGNIPGVKAALGYIKPEGKIAAAGLPSRPIDFDFSEFVYRGLSLKGIAGRLMYKTWEDLAGLLDAGVDIAPVITHVMPMADYAEGLRLMRAGECGKVILKPEWS
ncbi:MAG: L-threonine 3-dehydrogenase [Planctomycetes bacterium]|nr:L-threonine 3-dehydrogenase [Planctomycetota bacterium]